MNVMSHGVTPLQSTTFFTSNQPTLSVFVTVAATFPPPSIVRVERSQVGVHRFVFASSASVTTLPVGSASLVQVWPAATVQAPLRVELSGRVADQVPEKSPTGYASAPFQSIALVTEKVPRSEPEAPPPTANFVTSTPVSHDSSGKEDVIVARSSHGPSPVKVMSSRSRKKTLPISAGSPWVVTRHACSAPSTGVAVAGMY
ncbi:MAG: hypothetical protein BGO96_03260 [Micrococcales bacterium 73-15]|nr:MAG: hypothetical protein BGO96_03260 [Micrococcales bacterium 73-15]